MKSIPSSVWFLGTLVLGAVFIGILVLSANQQLRENVELPIEIVEYFDYRCPHCATAYSEVESLKDTYGDDIEVIARHFPLPVGANSFELAYGAEAARNQDKFKEYHDEVFVREIAYLNGEVDDSQVDAFLAAEAIGLDMDRFARDIESDAVISKVEADKRKGTRAGVAGTPAFFVEGQRVANTSLTEAVSQYIELASQNQDQ